MPELIVHTADGTHQLSFSSSTCLFDLIAQFPDAPDRNCGGSGTCGKCSVYASGKMSVQPDTNGRVLACQTNVEGNAEVWLPKRSILTQIETRTFSSEVQTFFGMDGFGIAVDLGTTTIVLQLLDLKNGNILSTVSCENPQRLIAADVIGRIDGALKGKLPLLHSLVTSCIDELEQKAFLQAGIPPKADMRVIAGNTTMLYLLTRRNPESLSAAPFHADCLFGFSQGRNYLPSCAGAFVGADITCAVLASRMCEKSETSMLIDIGTNGEIALWHKGKITCCATAAGPAFEGAGLTCGTGSVPGAIASAKAENGCLSITTIENIAPQGICGSGLIDLIASLLELEQLDETGCLDDDVILSSSVKLTQHDVRQVQLAKGAIAAGIELLLGQASIGYDDVTTLYIAGGFGSHLNLHNAARIGLLPPKLSEKAVVLGNASLAGARMLFSSENRKKALQITENAECINLAADPLFSNTFVECMMFDA